MGLKGSTEGAYVVLLYGPFLDTKSSSSYGGGTGGYTRNMATYLNHIKLSNYRIVPSFHSIRGQLVLDFFFWRMIFDTSSFIRDIYAKRPVIVHVLAQYRSAMPREFMVSVVSRFFGKPLIYEIKAGAFIDWYGSTSSINRYMISKVVKSASKVMVEGVPYLGFLKSEFGVDAVYQPNYVPSSLVPKVVPDVLQGKVLRVLFVGYCYRDKGVYELIEGCNAAANNGVKIELTLVGKEHDNFKIWVDRIQPTNGLIINRLGQSDYSDVLNEFRRHDIYCYPTSHSGEGHNNTINEAMMYGLVIVTTVAGFLETIITEDRGYLLQRVCPQLISDILIDIDSDRSGAVKKSKAAREHLISNFTSDQIFPTLESIYDEALPSG